jgi:serine/threonine protein kinase
MTDYVGKQFGHYRLLRLLGAGNFAAVYLGEHRYLEVPAAIKVLHVRMESDTHDIFLREARTIARLRHPHIVRVLDFGVEEQIPYLVMEYCPNGTLRTRHSKATRLPTEFIVRYVQQIASALDYAHQQGVIHRDIKPENLLLNERDEVVISDFGLAIVQRTLDSISAPNLAGTPVYMAPEQIQRHPCPASDQYALGIMVYEWLTGEPPFPGPGLALFVQHMYQAPPGLLARLPHLHPTVEEVVLQALAKDPQQRFATVQDFAQALEEVCTTTQPLALRSPHPRESIPAVPTIVPSTNQQDDATDARQPALQPTRYADSKQDLVPIASTPSEKRSSLPGANQAPSTLAQRNRQILLRKVRSFWIEGVLQHSLHGAALLTLGLQAQPDAVANPWHLVLQQPEATPHPLPAGTRITQVYDAADGELLILGAPGAGKTTLLLELARDLLVRAEMDTMHPMPVVFNLSSWAIKQLPLLDWLVEELTGKYQVPTKLAQALVRADQILPLLDGLDEVETRARTACIEAINVYRQEHGLLPLVVCSRHADYLVQSARVLVRSAVTVQSLTQEQIDAYLTQGGEPLWALRLALHQDATLRDLTSTPLMLSILTLTYYGKPVEDLLRKTTLEERQRLIFEQYVGRMLTRRGPLKGGTPQQVVQWLAFLAARMRERNQTVFYLEQLQPDWLSAAERRKYNGLGVRLPGVLVGILAALGISVTGTVLRGPYQFVFSGVLGGLLGSLFSEGTLRQTSVANKIHPKLANRHRFGGQVVISALTGLLVALSGGLYLGKQFGLIDWFHYGSAVGIVTSLGSLFLQLLLSPATPLTSSSNSHNTRRWKRLVRTIHGQRAWRVTLVIGLIGSLNALLTSDLVIRLVSRPISELTVALVSALNAGLTTGIIFGSIGVLVSLILHAQAAGVSLSERLRWTWKSLISSLLRSKHIKITFLLISIYAIGIGLQSALSSTLSFGLITGLVLALINGLEYGLIIGLSYWIISGLFQGISSEQIEERSRLIPGQGIQRSLHNCALMGSISFGVIWLISILSYTLGEALYYGVGSELYYELGLTGAEYGTKNPGPIFWLIYGLDSGWQIGLYNGLAIALCGGLLVCAMSGGIAVWRHGVIRLLLRRAGAFPRHYVRFLDEAANCILLQKIGGGYSFVHRLLLEYFASLEQSRRSETR